MPIIAHMPDLAMESSERDKKKKSPAFLIVTGLSGAGKSTALRVLEDIGYFTVDGLPPDLSGQMIDMMRNPSMTHFHGIALGMDIRQTGSPDKIKSVIAGLKKLGIEPKILFFEAAHDVLMRRYAATRRPHPLEREGQSLAPAIELEVQRLADIREIADLVIDTSFFSIHDLRRYLLNKWQDNFDLESRLMINILSFGFKHALPKDADMVFDIRFLPNPFFVEELKKLDGQNRSVSDYVFSCPQANEFLERLLSLLIYVFRQMEAEGRYRLTVAIGCTGGKHRSVAFAEELGKRISEAGYPVNIEHKHKTLN